MPDEEGLFPNYLEMTEEEFEKALDGMLKDEMRSAMFQMKSELEGIKNKLAAMPMALTPKTSKTHAETLRSIGMKPEDMPIVGQQYCHWITVDGKKGMETLYSKTERRYTKIPKLIQITHVAIPPDDIQPQTVTPLRSARIGLVGNKLSTDPPGIFPKESEPEKIPIQAWWNMVSNQGWRLFEDTLADTKAQR